MDQFLTRLYLTFFCIAATFQDARSQCNNELDTNAQNLHAQNQNTEPILNDPKLRKLVEQKFLEFMGLKKKPDASLKSKVKVPNEMWKLYCKWSNENYNDPLKNDVDNVRLVDQEADDFDDETQHRSHPHPPLRFNMSAVKRPNILHRAELLLFTENIRSIPLRGSKFLTFYNENEDKQKNQKNVSSSKKQTLISVKKIPRNRNGYVKVDITKILTTWLIGLPDAIFRVRATQSSRERSTHLHVRKRRSYSESKWVERKPLLFLYMSTEPKRKSTNKMKIGKASRGRRSSESSKDTGDGDAKHLHVSSKHKHKETCRLRPYYLDFVKRQWDVWIIAPRGYKLNYCLGECPSPLGRHYNVTNHAVIQNALIRLSNRNFISPGSVPVSSYRESVPKLCCIPTDLRDQTFLYMDTSGQLSLKNPSEMSAVGCGCR